MAHSFLTVIVPSVIAFVATNISSRFLLTYLASAGIMDEDHNKERVVLLPLGSGLAVVFGIIVGILVYTFGSSFMIFKPVVNVSQLLAVALSISLIGFVGFLDDIHVKARSVMTTDLKRRKLGLKQWQKPLLTVLGALPLMAINAGTSVVFVPFFGQIDLGLLYPLLILPLAVIFFSNAINLLGGYDDLQTGMTAVAAIGLLIYSILFGNAIGTLISALLLASVLAFVPFNTYKAKTIPGDTFTYAMGATIIAIMVMGNAEAFGLIIFIPWIIEFILHLLRKFNVTDLGIRQNDGTFKAPYGKRVYSLTHLLMNWKPLNEKQIARYLIAFEAFFVVFAFILKLAAFL